jgi:hypothetical protein
MNDYTITLVYDQFNITTVIYADNEEEAKRWALQKLDQECGITLGEPMEYQIELEGTFEDYKRG